MNGAIPNTTFQVTILFYFADPTCTTAPGAIPTATLTTNGSGNGNARFTFPAGPPSTLPTSGIRWTFSTPAGVAYTTTCAPLVLDSTGRRAAFRREAALPACYDSCVTPLVASMSTLVGPVPEMDDTGTVAGQAVLPWLQDLDGFRGMMILTDEAQDKARVLTFWESHDAAERSLTTRHTFRTAWPRPSAWRSSRPRATSSRPSSSSTAPRSAGRAGPEPMRVRCYTPRAAA